MPTVQSRVRSRCAPKKGAVTVGETREQELARLIREQQADDTHYVQSEPFTVPFGFLADVMDEDGRLVTDRLPAYGEPECALHGGSEAVTAVDGSFRCRACDRDRKRQQYRTSQAVRERKRAAQAAYRRRMKGDG